jgi:hypothetical protein
MKVFSSTALDVRYKGLPIVTGLEGQVHYRRLQPPPKTVSSGDTKGPLCRTRAYLPDHTGSNCVGAPVKRVANRRSNGPSLIG